MEDSDNTKLNHCHWRHKHRKYLLTQLSAVGDNKLPNLFLGFQLCQYADNWTCHGEAEKEGVQNRFKGAQPKQILISTIINIKKILQLLVPLLNNSAKVQNGFLRYAFKKKLLRRRHWSILIYPPPPYPKWDKRNRDTKNYISPLWQ